jgi:anti-anti-sigma factor
VLLDADHLAAGAAAGASEIRLTGEMDLATAETMLAPAHQLVAEGHCHFVLNCAALEFCDSHGLMEMFRLAKAVEPDGSVTIAHPSDTLVKLLTLTGLSDLFTISASE